jgi:GNAT superfamily N-acetyltransferase
VKVFVSPEPVRLRALQTFRDLYRLELACQIVHDSHHKRGFLKSFWIHTERMVAGYGSTNAEGTIKEFYVLPDWRTHSAELFKALLTGTQATAIEAQSNDPLLMPMLERFATGITSDTILFADDVETNLTAPGAVVRRLRWYEKRAVFPHTVEPVGDWGLRYNGEVVATGGFFLHYNRPYADIYMEVALPFRRRGFGAFLVQELKQLAREAGHTPAARCNSDNAASQATLRRAGMRPCGHIARGMVAR